MAAKTESTRSSFGGLAHASKGHASSRSLALQRDDTCDEHNSRQLLAWKRRTLTSKQGGLLGPALFLANETVAVL